MSLVGRIQEREVCSDPAQPQHWIKLTCHKESFPEFPHTTSCPLRQACQLLSPHDKLPHAAIQDTTLCVNGTTVHWNIFPFYLRVSLKPCPFTEFYPLASRVLPRCKPRDIECTRAGTRSIDRRFVPNGRLR